MRGVTQPAPASALEAGSETLVYTSLRPNNWDVYLFDGLDAPPRRLTDHPNLDYWSVRRGLTVPGTAGGTPAVPGASTSIHGARSTSGYFSALVDRGGGPR